jgi:hypothetical protein
MNNAPSQVVGASAAAAGAAEHHGCEGRRVEAARGAEERRSGHGVGGGADGFQAAWTWWGSVRVAPMASGASRNLGRVMGPGADGRVGGEEIRTNWMDCVASRMRSC